MNIKLLDMVWPALYVSETFWRFWYLVIGTIIIELFVIKYFLRFSWKKSFYVSLIGNCVSGVAGTFLMTIGMIFWHAIVDNFVHGTFNKFNWVATYVLMCFGSVWLETYTIKIIFKEPIKKLFLPMLTGNLLSYLFIVWIMISPAAQDRWETESEKMKYSASKQQIVLLDHSELKIDSTIMSVWYTRSKKNGNEALTADYFMTIHYNRPVNNTERGYPFELTILDSSSIGWQNSDSCVFHFSKLQKEYKILLNQRNPDTAVSWLRPIITDTLRFKRILNR